MRVFMQNTTNSENGDKLTPDVRGYAAEAAACTAFAEAINSGESEALLANLAPKVEFTSKWVRLDGVAEVTDYLNEWFFSPSKKQQTAFVGTLVSDDRSFPCAYSLRTIKDPSFTLTFGLTNDGKVGKIFSYPPHHLWHRDGKLYDRLG